MYTSRDRILLTGVFATMVMEGRGGRQPCSFHILFGFRCTRANRLSLFTYTCILQPTSSRISRTACGNLGAFRRHKVSVSGRLNCRVPIIRGLVCVNVIQTHKRFTRTLFIRTKTQSANFRVNRLRQATKRHLTNS